MKPLLSLLGSENQSGGAMVWHRPTRGIRAIVLVAACLAIFTVIFWRVAPLARTSLASGRKAARSSGFNPKLAAGVGTEVIFVTGNTEQDQVRRSVDSLDAFIAGRSGLALGQDTKARLITAESDTLAGKTPRIQVDGFVSALTGVIAERVSSLTDQEIDDVTATLSSTGSIKLRSHLRLGMLREELVQEASSLREGCRQNDSATLTQIRGFLGDEVEKRINTLSEGLPNQFGLIAKKGLTPAQAVLVTYSVVSDDSLEFSHVQIGNMARRSQLSKLAGDSMVAANAKAYGPQGRVFASPTDLIFNNATIPVLIDRLANGGNEK